VITTLQDLILQLVDLSNSGQKNVTVNVSGRWVQIRSVTVDPNGFGAFINTEE